MDHASRDRVVNEFRRGETKILIATDVLARGFDVSQVSVLQLFGG
jgi:ATP-dependent RNA helicase DDX19/DBP5